MNTQKRCCVVICDNGQRISQKDKAVMNSNKQIKNILRKTFEKHINILKHGFEKTKHTILKQIRTAEQAPAEDIRKFRKTAISVFCTGVAICAFSIFFTAGYDVYLDGKLMGSVGEKEDFEKIITEVNSAAEELSGSSYGSVLYEPTFIMKISLRSSLSDADELRADVSELSDTVRYGTTVIVDGTPAFTAENSETAQTAIDKVMASYGSGEAKLLTNVGFAGEYTEKNSLESYDGAYLKLRNLLKVETVRDVIYNEDIPYETATVEDATMYEGDKAVTVAGVPGKQRVVANVTYVNGIESSRNIISSEEISSASVETVAIGTKKRPSDIGTGVMMLPFSGSVSSRFGARDGRRTSHKGVDLAGASGSPVAAADNGKVIQAEYRYDYGNIIVIDHNNGLITYYAHLSKINVSVGDVVEKGQTIGLVGSTGISTGPHLHFEVRRDGTPIDPYSYMN